MNKINIIYWTQSGNTQSMAETIAKGITENGGDANIVEVSAATTEMVSEANTFALGCPAMGAEVLEESEMEPFVSSIEDKVNGKEILLFGSYGWGDGQWMRDWEERLKNAGATIIGDEEIICMDAPDDETIDKCIEAGKKLAKML